MTAARRSGNAPRPGRRLDAEFDILVDSVVEASTSGPHADAYREAMHYAEQYREDGGVLVVERVTVARLPRRVRA